jgi:hypothetical protein
MYIQSLFVNEFDDNILLAGQSYNLTLSIAGYGIVMRLSNTGYIEWMNSILG